MTNPSASAESGSRLHFVRYTCAMRALGFCTGMLGIGAALQQQGAATTTTLLLVLTCVGWPVLAWRLSNAASDPLDAEFRNLVIDTGLAGLWIAIAQFDLLPSALLAAVMAMDRTVAGGWALTRRSIAVMAGVALVVAAFNGFAFQPRTHFSTMLWCMPFLSLYLLAIGASTRLFADKVRAQKRRLEQGSRIDAQTGLTTRPQWMALVAAELRRFHRYAAVSSLLMVDIDRFKRINDGAGHLAGDQVIRDVCAILRAELRSADTAGRYGGDEFGVLLPGTDRGAAMEVAERLRRAVAAQVSVDGVPVTLSIGLGRAGAGHGGDRGLDGCRGRRAVPGQGRRARLRPRLTGRLIPRTGGSRAPPGGPCSAGTCISHGADRVSRPAPKTTPPSAMRRPGRCSQRFMRAPDQVSGSITGSVARPKAAITSAPPPALACSQGHGEQAHAQAARHPAPQRAQRDTPPGAVGGQQAPVQRLQPAPGAGAGAGHKSNRPPRSSRRSATRTSATPAAMRTPMASASMRSTRSRPPPSPPASAPAMT